MYIKGRENGNCNLCEYGHFDSEKKGFMCMLKGEVTNEDDSCKKFRYDPLKRTPDTVKLRSDFSEEDFSL